MKKLVRLFLWIILGFLATGLAFWTFMTEAGHSNPMLVVLVVAIYAVGPIGAFWMMYMSIRHERNPVPMILMAFVPYAFLWYYFERVRTRRHMTEGRNPGIHS
jgi:drug/metabolite transporter (DMT)-like permease